MLGGVLLSPHLRQGRIQGLEMQIRLGQSAGLALPVWGSITGRPLPLAGEVAAASCSCVLRVVCLDLSTMRYCVCGVLFPGRYPVG